jgi:hypothetical protein
MGSAALFCVQTRISTNPLAFSSGQTVEATGPLDAARRVLGNLVSMSGNSPMPCARVMSLDSQFRTVSINIYAREEADR